MDLQPIKIAIVVGAQPFLVPIWAPNFESLMLRFNAGKKSVFKLGRWGQQTNFKVLCKIVDLMMYFGTGVNAFKASWISIF